MKNKKEAINNIKLAIEISEHLKDQKLIEI
jgi:hypothetical protein